jgi:hypothetical protein
MALRWAAATQEAFKVFRRLKAKNHLPALRAALEGKANGRLSTQRLFKSPRLRKILCATTASRISTDCGTSPKAGLVIS